MLKVVETGSSSVAEGSVETGSTSVAEGSVTCSHQHLICAFVK